MSVDPDDMGAPNVRARLDAAADELRSLGVHHVHSFSWRDLDDEEAGGSEIHHDEVFSRWAGCGLDIQHRSSSLHGTRLIERRGYRIVQAGSRYSVFPRAVLAEAMRRCGPRDAVIEIWNGVPWFSPVWHRGPQTTWLHHVHGPMWQQQFPRPVAALGRALEMNVAPRFYRRHPVVTLAPASRDELLDLGFPADNVSVVPPGVHDRFSPSDLPRDDRPLVVAAGRLAPVKRFDALLVAVADARRRIPDLRVEIIGEGPLRSELETWIRDNHASEWATLRGRVTDDELVHTYRRAWIVASASLAEGWGMTLTEAGACGTPAVATDVVGHRGAVVDGQTGDLVADPGDLGTAIAELIRDTPRRETYGRHAVARRASFSWDSTAAQLLEVLLSDARRLSRQRGDVIRESTDR